MEIYEIMYTFKLSLSHSLSMALVPHCKKPVCSVSVLLVLKVYLSPTYTSLENLLEVHIPGSQADLQAMRFWGDDPKQCLINTSE